VNQVPLWRIVAAIVVLAVLVLFAVLFAPVYVHNLELQNFVADVAARQDTQSKSDDLVRTWVLDKAHQLDLPVHADNVKIAHSPDGLRIDVRYQVKVDFPGYTVNLHFYPGAGSQ
jgi:cell division protein FtsL